MTALAFSRSFFLAEELLASSSCPGLIKGSYLLVVPSSVHTFSWLHLAFRVTTFHKNMKLIPLVSLRQTDIPVIPRLIKRLNCFNNPILIGTVHSDQSPFERLLWGIWRLPNPGAFKIGPADGSEDDPPLRMAAMLYCPSFGSIAGVWGIS